MSGAREMLNEAATQLIFNGKFILNIRRSAHDKK